MKFSRIKDDLAQLERKSDVTAADVLNCVYDLCQDIQTDTGSPVERKEPGSGDDLSRMLPWVGRLICRLYQKGESQIMSPVLRQRLSEIGAELTQLEGKIQNAEGESSRLAEQERQLQDKKTKLRKNQELIAQIRARCAELETANEAAQTEDVLPLYSRWEELKQRQQELRQECESCQSEIDALTGKVGELEAENRSLSDEAGALARRNEQAMELRQQLTEQMFQTQLQLEQWEQERGTLDERKQALEECCRTAGQELDRLKEQVLRPVEASLGLLEQERQTLLEQQSQLEDRRSHLQQQLERQRQENETLQTRCREAEDQAEEQETLRAALEEKLAGGRTRTQRGKDEQIELDDRLAAALSACQQLEQELLPQHRRQLEDQQGRQMALAGQREKLEESIRSLQENISALEQTIGRDEDNFRQLGRQRLELEERRSQLTADRNRRSGECDGLRQKIEQLNEEIARRDFDRVRRDLEAVLREKEGLLEECRRLERELIGQREAAKEQRATAQNLIGQKKTDLAAMEQARQETQTAVSKLDAELTRLSKDRSQLLAQLEQLRQERDELVLWFGQTDARRCREEIDRLFARVRQMKQAQESLRGEYRFFAQTYGMTDQELEEKLAFQTSIDQLSQQLERFREQYRQLLQSFGGEV